MTHRSGRFLVAMVGVVALSVSLVQAQVQSQNGRIQGQVSDPGGAIIIGASVEADEVDTQTISRTETNSSGHFEFPSLKPGRYNVKIAKPGFGTTLQENLTLTVGLTTSLNLTLRIASNNEEVVVTSAPLIDVTTDLFFNDAGGAGRWADDTGAEPQI